MKQYPRSQPAFLRREQDKVTSSIASLRIASQLIVAFKNSNPPPVILDSA